MVILEGGPVVSIFRLLHTECSLLTFSAFGSVGFQQVFFSVAMETALAKVLALPVLALVVEEAVEVLDPGVVKFVGLFDQQQVDLCHLVWLLAETVDVNALVPAKDVDDLEKMFCQQDG